mgnify:CR=1 FL=1
MTQLILFKVRDLRKKDQYKIDDKYLNGYAKIFGVSTTAVYNSLARHAEFYSQAAFPSENLIAEEHNITTRTVRTAIKKLKSANIIKIERKRQKGKWLNNLYCLVDKSEWLLPEEIKDLWLPPEEIKDKKPEEITRGKIRPTKDNKGKDNKEEKDTKNDNELEFSDLLKKYPLFAKFYKLYPRKNNGRVALKVFNKLVPTQALLETILKDIDRKKKSEQWRKDNGKYIQYPATYLNQRRWEDEEPQKENLKDEIYGH